MELKVHGTKEDKEQSKLKRMEVKENYDKSERERANEVKEVSAAGRRPMLRFYVFSKELASRGRWKMELSSRSFHS